MQPLCGITEGVYAIMSNLIARNVQYLLGYTDIQILLNETVNDFYAHINFQVIK